LIPHATSSPTRPWKSFIRKRRKDILQVDYMWHAWDNSQMHRIAPNIDEMLAIWQEELAAAK
jgi:spermidine/putrescine transport system substrate-binding protein